jgi:hypothetical protein
MILTFVQLGYFPDGLGRPAARIAALQVPKMRCTAVLMDVGKIELVYRHIKNWGYSHWLSDHCL